MTSPTLEPPSDDPVVHFNPPVGFEDLTDYHFEAADGRSWLSVHHGVPGPGETQTVEMAVATYLTQLHRLFPPLDLAFLSVGPAGESPLPAQRLAFTFADGGSQWRQQSLLGRLSDGSGLQINYVTSETDTTAERCFAEVVRSIRPHGEVVLPTLTGFIPRRVKGINLNVPVELRAPSNYQFVTSNGKARVNLRVTAADQAAHALAMHQPSIPPGATITEAGEYQGMKMYEVKRTGAAGPVEHYACREVKRLPNGLLTVVTGQSAADEASARLMQQAVVGLVQSIRAPGEGT